MKIAQSNRRWLFLVLVVAALAAVACGGSATATPRPTEPATVAIPPTTVTDGTAALTAEEEEYIEQVRASWRDFHEKAEGFREVFGQVYAIKARLFEALHDAGAGTALVDTLQSMETLTPPARYQEDHQLMVQALAEQVVYDRDVGAAVENEDLAAFAIANARLTESSLQMISRLDPSVCPATEPSDVLFPLCGLFSETVPGGDYGNQIYDVMARLTAGVFSRFIQFGPHYDAEDIQGTLTVLQPELTQVYRETMGEIQGIQAPDAFAADHSLLVKYIDEILAVEQARSTAVAAQDLRAYQSLSGEARTLFCDARAQLGAGELRDVVRVMFLDAAGICGGSDY